MWIKPATRKEFLEIVQSARMPPSSQLQRVTTVSTALYSRDELQLLWPELPEQINQLPVAVIIDDGHRRDFIAWVSTYLPNLRPFTAYCRVVDAGTAETSLRRTEPPSLGRLQEACLGLILGEAATHVEGRLEPRNLSPNACASTYSFAMARAFSIGLLEVGLEGVSRSWFATRTVTRQPELSLRPEELETPWRIALNIGRTDSFSLKPSLDAVLVPIAEACHDLCTSGDIQGQRWETVTRNFPEIRSVREEMLGRREDRVTIFEKALGSLLHTRRTDSASAGFLAGYLASQISPGSLDHLELLTPAVRSISSVYLWYGLCAGMHARSDLQNYSAGLGRRVLRDLLQDDGFLDRPRCDIALAELNVFNDVPSPKLEFHTRFRGHVEVEIAPCVSSIVRWPPREGLAPYQALDRTGARQLLEDIQQALSRVQSVQSRLARLLGNGGASPSGSDKTGRDR